MFSDIQLSYAQSMIGTYRRQGYDNYILAQGIKDVQGGQPYDVFLYFSKDKFSYVSPTRFSCDGDVIQISIDSSNYNQNNTDSMLSYSVLKSPTIDFNRSVSVYTNCEYKTLTGQFMPDLMEREGATVGALDKISFLLLVFVLLIVFIRIFR